MTGTLHISWGNLLFKEKNSKLVQWRTYSLQFSVHDIFNCKAIKEKVFQNLFQTRRHGSAETVPTQIAMDSAKPKRNNDSD